MEAYNQFVCGWVKEVKIWGKGGKYLTTGHVNACSLADLIPFNTGSSFTETLLSCWIEESGVICCAHYNCIAGLGETCTH